MVVRKRMNVMIRFQAPKALKEKFWALCYDRGLLPSQVLRQAMVNEVERMERLEANQNHSQTEKEAEQP